MDHGTTGSSVLDRSQLEEATGGEPELIRELAELYVLDAKPQLDALGAAVAQGDHGEVHRLAHGLKGSSASIGATEAAAAFQALELMGRNAQTEHMAAAFSAAEAAFERARAALATL